MSEAAKPEEKKPLSPKTLTPAEQEIDALAKKEGITRARAAEIIARRKAAPAEKFIDLPESATHIEAEKAAKGGA